eukprot:2434130-Amphidinium_carterae.1
MSFKGSGFPLDNVCLGRMMNFSMFGSKESGSAAPENKWQKSPASSSNGLEQSLLKRLLDAALAFCWYPSSGQ